VHPGHDVRQPVGTHLGSQGLGPHAVRRVDRGYRRAAGARGGDQLRPTVSRVLGVRREPALDQQVRDALDALPSQAHGTRDLRHALRLAQRGAEAHVHSLEHDPGWAERTRDALTAEGLQEWATVTHAPLRDGWYDVSLAGDLDFDALGEITPRVLEEAVAEAHDDQVPLSGCVPGVTGRVGSVPSPV